MSYTYNDKIESRIRLAYNEVSDMIHLTQMIVINLSRSETNLTVLKSNKQNLIDSGESSTEAYDIHLKILEQSILLNKGQAENGYTKIYEMSLVYLWGRMDNLIKDVLVEYIDTDSKLLEFKNIPKFKLDVAYITLSKNEQKYYLISQIEQSIGGSLKLGVKKFESLLEVFDLSGKVPKVLSDKIFEFSNIRNIIAHNSSFVDSRFIERCPNFNYTIGQRLSIKESQFASLAFALLGYLHVLSMRLTGGEIDEEKFTEFLNFETI